MDSITKALFQSILHGPVLVGDLPEAPVFDRDRLAMPVEAPPLDLEQKLGHLFEDALAALFEHSEAFEISQRNLQLQPDAQTTLGELDFVIRDRRDGGLVHLELATKFYLSIETEDGYQFPGPDPSDNYDNKIRRLRSHQLQLPALHPTTLPEALQEGPLVTRQLVFGALFDSIHSPRRASPDFIHPACRRGRWLRLSECDEFLGADAKLELIPKHLWSTPFDLLGEIPLTLWKTPAALERCVMLRVDGGNEPFFVVPAHYPDTQAPRLA
ncbi:DUF1853 family protein [Haloferula sp.]|uniref:DUF1853 family protein n=1 Tax=Haloferula sp. TaxID=2497595 RepID=UPI0032A06DC0